ncbi:MAG: hypothetical protein QF893_01835 [Alphaproteobacteria bacterium]|jgi:hypothetical protein|nr:hypothetical protein [Alphaproteobacteria bacterium]
MNDCSPSAVDVDYEKAWFWLRLSEIQKPDPSAYYQDQIRDRLTAKTRQEIDKRASHWLPRS